MGDPFREALSLKIDSVCPGASGRLDRIDEFPDSAGMAIVMVLLEHACESQHVGNILSAREALLRLPRSWLATVLPDAIDGAVDLGDEWEYRRLIELLKELHSELVDSYIDYGISAGSGEIFEAATDLKGR